MAWSARPRLLAMGAGGWVPPLRQRKRGKALTRLFAVCSNAGSIRTLVWDVALMDSDCKVV